MKWMNLTIAILDFGVRILEVVELMIRSVTSKVCDSVRPAMLLFLSHRAPRLCNS